MNWDAIGAVGEILGAGGVIVSLFYLAIQIRGQNRESRLAAMHEISNAFREAYTRFNDGEIAEIFARGNSDYDSLTVTEKVRLFSTVNPLIKVLEEAFWQHENGRLDDEIWLPLKNQFAFFLGADSFVQVWAQRQRLYSEKFKEFVNGMEKHEYEIG
jgi:hypothetical protein